MENQRIHNLIALNKEMKINSPPTKRCRSKSVNSKRRFCNLKPTKQLTQRMSPGTPKEHKNIQPRKYQRFSKQSPTECKQKSHRQLHFSKPQNPWERKLPASIMQDYKSTQQLFKQPTWMYQFKETKRKLPKTRKFVGFLSTLDESADAVYLKEQLSEKEQLIHQLQNDVIAIKKQLRDNNVHPPTYAESQKIH